VKKLALASILMAVAGLHAARPVPRFEQDPYWPKPLPNNWMLGQVGGIYVDSHDHVWVTSRPKTLDENDTYAAAGKSDCCIPSPPILEFDQAGNLVQAWGGPGQGYDWPDNEHGMFIDHNENVWIGGNSVDKDTSILKFTKAGKFLLQIGKHTKSGGSNDTTTLNRPAGFHVDPKTNEIYVADGYGNRRIIVFDAATGAYKRHWGAYGKPPDDAAPRTRLYEGPGPQQFNTVHAVRLSNDGLLYVGDRVNNRIQVFHPDGSFVKEAYIERKTSATEGTAFDIAFSPDKAQRFLYVPDGSNKKVQILDRETLEVLGFFGGHGGHGVGQFFHIHSIATDSKGNIYIGESFGKRVTKWTYKGM
jgi:DNA-binding beta-propeller fold protein YncE